MIKNKIIVKLKPLLLIKTISNYIKDEDFIFKLFIYSKSIQKKLDIHLIDYQVRFINKKGIDFNRFLTFKDNYKENELDNLLQETLFKNKIDLNINILQKIVIRYFKKKFRLYNEKKKIEEYIYIDIYSPFFDSLSKSEIFDFFTIKIKIKDIEKFNLKNDYISIFDKMNKSKCNYSSLIFRFEKSEDIHYLEDFKINFGQITKLIIHQDFNSYIEDYNNFFKILFSFNDITKNLIYLNLYILNSNLNNSIIYIDPNSLENLNKCKSLRYLELYGFNFKQNFYINLFNLKSLIIFCSENIIYTDKDSLNLKTLSLFSNSNVKPKYFLKLPEVENCTFESKIYLKEKFSSMIDFSSLKQLKDLKAEASDFLNLDNNILLEKIDLKSELNISKETEIKMIEKLLSIKTLNIVSFELKKIDVNEILTIPGENPFIKIININVRNDNKDLFLNKIQNKFPGANKLSLYLSNFSLNQKINLQIRQNPNCKINKFSLSGNGEKNIIIDIQSFEKLELIEIDCLFSDISNLKEAFPFFNNDYQIKYNSLSHFHFLFYYKSEINFEILNNLFNNIDNMPNLKYFYLDCITKEIDENFYIKLIRKLLAQKIEIINLKIKKNSKLDKKNNIYSFNELKEIFPEYDNSKIKRVFISKL